MHTMNVFAKPHMRNLSELSFLMVIYSGGVIALNITLPNMLTIAGASLAGAICLVYFRRDRDYWEILKKGAIGTISGLVAGSVAVRYFDLESTEYVIGMYFTASMCTIFFIRALIAVTDNNASAIIVTIIQRVFNVSSLPRVVPDNSEAPPFDAIPKTQIVQTEVIVSKQGEVEK